jgi:basic amino acid/polyamine antiporter, APA family
MIKQESTLKREIGQLGFAAITLNGVIGGGLFVLPAIAAAKVGWLSPWLFLLCGTLFMTIVLCFARLGSLFQQTGGPSVYVLQSFGPFWGFQTGWLLCIGRVIAMAANANLMATYLAWFFPELNTLWARNTMICLVIGGLTVVNYVGVRQGLQTIFILTVLKLLPLVLLITVGIPHLTWSTAEITDLPAMTVLGETILVLFYAFVGFESGSVNAGEAQQPKRDIPRALVKTVLFTAFVYFLLQWLCMSVLPDLGQSTQPLADVALVLLGEWGAGLMAFAAIVSISGNLSSIMLATPRMSYALARDRCLPKWFGELHPRYSTPMYSILFVGGSSLALAVSNTFIYLAVLATLVRLVGYVLCIASLPLLEKRAGLWPIGLAVVRASFIPLFALVLCLILMSFASMQAWFTLLAFSVAGSGLFWLARRHTDHAMDN